MADEEPVLAELIDERQRPFLVRPLRLWPWILIGAFLILVAATAEDAWKFATDPIRFDLFKE